MYAVGIMQGRLSPRRERVQSFPADAWKLEFERARALGFEAIEWLVTNERGTENPIWHDAGIEEIGALAVMHRLTVPSVCADYLIAQPLASQSSCNQLEELIGRAARVGAGVVLIPLLDAASVRSDTQKAALLARLKGPLATAATHGVSLALESDLPIEEVCALAATADQPALGIYYDTGNAAALGYDIVKEIVSAGPYLRGVHIKDRVRGGPNVPLGEGDVDFGPFLSALASTNYAGPLILETTVGDDWQANARSNLAFVLRGLAQVGAGA